MLESMDKEGKAIKQEALKMSWYMRGGLTYDQVLQLSGVERAQIGELIKENLETTKKSGLPFF
jgi:cell division inhibitor SulA